MSNKNRFRLFHRLLVSLISFVIFFSATEIMLGFFGYELYYENEFFPLQGDIDFHRIFQEDSNRFWRFTPNSNIESKLFQNLSYTTNSLGMRCREISAEKKNTRVIALGNSCTFGWGVPLSQTWTTVLQSYLNENSPEQNWEVLNAGVPGYSSFQGIAYLNKELLALQPDYLIMMFGWNDHWTAVGGKPDSEHKLTPAFILDIKNLISTTKTYRFTRKLILSNLSKKETVAFDQMKGKRRVPIDQFHKNLTEMIDITRQNDIVPILVIPPVACAELYFGGAELYLHQLHKSYQDQIRRVAKYKQALLIDLQAPFDKNANMFDDAYSDPIHFNKSGHQLAAFTICAELSPPLAKK